MAGRPTVTFAREGSDEERWNLPRLFGPAAARGPEHTADLRELAELFEDPHRFLHDELSGEPGRELRTYRLRGSRLAVVLRPCSRDLGVLDEVFRRRYYELPPPVERLLGSAGRAPRIVDVGAHVGLSLTWFAERLPGAEFVAFEPDPANLTVLREWASANRGAVRCRIVAACAGTAPGRVPFLVDFSSSRTARDGETADTHVRQVDALPQIADGDLLKMDMEGGEWALLADPRLRESTLRAIVLEFHPHLCPEPNPRDAVQRLLRAAGFEGFEPLFERSDGVGMAWGWRSV